jgi:MbtH protein
MSASCFDREDEIFRVLVNHEEQYSLWPEWKPVPAGWNDVGVVGDKKTCLAHIDKVWTDMRPRSLREWMAQQDQSTQGTSGSADAATA